MESINRCVFYSRIQVLKYLSTVLKPEDKVIVYHSVAYANIVRLVKIIKKFKLVFWKSGNIFRCKWK